MIPKTPFQYQLWINGKEVPSGSGKKFERKSPAHGTLVGEYARADAADVDAAVRTDEATYKVTEAAFTFVAVDEDRKPRLVPPERHHD